MGVSTTSRGPRSFPHTKCIIPTLGETDDVAFSDALHTTGRGQFSSVTDSSVLREGVAQRWVHVDVRAS